MKPKRRLGSENAKNRLLLVDAAERLMVEEGYAAVTARKVAAHAGLKVQLVYYYFENMDDLILEVARKSSNRRLKRFVRALASPDPLKALWELNRDATSGVSSTEMMALANHRESIRSEVVEIARQFRSLQIEAVDKLLAEKGVDRTRFPAAAIVTMIAALTRAMAQDRAMGATEGYAETVALVEHALTWLSRRETDTSTVGTPLPEIDKC